MVKFKQKFFLKLPLAFLLAFLVSQLLVTKVTYEKVPAIRPSFKAMVQKKIASLGKKTLPGHYLPPPWIEPVVNPTIVAYKPPIYNPPAATSQPTNPLPPRDTLPPTKGPTQNPPPTRPTLIPTPSPPLSPEPLPPPTGGQKKAQLLDFINQERQKHGIAALSYHGALDRASQGHAEDMVQRSYFSHTGRDGSTPADRAKRAGYGSSWVGENIAMGSSDPNYIFSMWMGSSGHRQNMLNPTWKSSGIGVSSTIWVLLLGAI